MIQEGIHYDTCVYLLTLPITSASSHNSVYGGLIYDKKCFDVLCETVKLKVHVCVI
jgi:hypothetical protein